MYMSMPQKGNNYVKKRINLSPLFIKFNQITYTKSINCKTLIANLSMSEWLMIIFTKDWIIIYNIIQYNTI